MMQGSSKGFTLVELLVTIAIIAILATVGLTMYQSYINKTICSDVEITVNEAMLEAVKQLNETGTAPSGEASALGINYPSTVSSVVISGSGTTASPITVNGTAVSNKCPKGTKYVLTENNSRGTWK